MPPATDAPRLSVVVPSHQTRELTRRCVHSLRTAAGAEGVEILVVDDGSTDGTAQAIADAAPEVRILRNETSRGFTTTANRGVAAARGELVLLLNSDTEVLPETLATLDLAFRRHPELGVGGARLVYPDGRPQWSHGAEPGLLWCFALASGTGPLFGRIRRALRPTPASGAGYRPTGWVTGAALAARRQVWKTVGPLDEGFAFYGQDLDFCLRARDAGWEVGVVEECVVVHRHGATIGGVDPEAQVRRQNPTLLWSDLVLWAERRGGRRRARRTALALAIGARLRLAVRRLIALGLDGPRREKWRQESRALAAALAALRDRQPGDGPPVSGRGRPTPPAAPPFR